MPTAERFAYGPVRIDLIERTVTRRGASQTLAPREIEALRYLLDRAGEVVSREELEREVWEYHAAVQSEAVPVCMRRLRQKLEAGQPRAEDPRDGARAGLAAAPPGPDPQPGPDPRSAAVRGAKRRAGVDPGRPRVPGAGAGGQWPPRDRQDAPGATAPAGLGSRRAVGGSGRDRRSAGPRGPESAGPWGQPPSIRPGPSMPCSTGVRGSWCSTGARISLWCCPIWSRPGSTPAPTSR